MKGATIFIMVSALAAGVRAGDEVDVPSQEAPRRIAITIDDLPVAQPSWHSDVQMDRITTDLLATLMRHRVPAVGFVNDGKLIQRIGSDYVRYMLEVVEFYEGQSEAIVGRAIPQVLLVHAYALNADRLGELLTALEVRGYHWVSLEEALEDPVYDRAIDGYTGTGGITWLHRWAITEGLDRSIFAGEPEPPRWVADIP